MGSRNRPRYPSSGLPCGSAHTRIRVVALQSSRLSLLLVAAFADATVCVADAVPERASWPATDRHAAGTATLQANLLTLTKYARTRISPRFGRPASRRQKPSLIAGSIS